MFVSPCGDVGRYSRGTRGRLFFDGHISHPEAFTRRFNDRQTLLLWLIIYFFIVLPTHLQLTWWEYYRAHCELSRTTRLGGTCLDRAIKSWLSCRVWNKPHFPSNVFLIMSMSILRLGIRQIDYQQDISLHAGKPCFLFRRELIFSWSTLIENPLPVWVVGFFRKELNFFRWRYF